MNQYFLVAVILSAAMSVNAAESKSSKGLTVWEEVSMPRLLPPRRSDPLRPYFDPQSIKDEFRVRVTELGNKGDVVPVVAERLKKLEPATEGKRGGERGSEVGMTFSGATNHRQGVAP